MNGKYISKIRNISILILMTLLLQSTGYSQETIFKGLLNFAFVNDGYIYVVENKGDDPRRVARGEAPDWSTVEPLLAFQGHKGGIFTFDLRTGKQKQIHKTGIEPRWSPNGALIAFRDGEKHNQLRVTDKNAVLRDPLDEIAPNSSGPFWMPDNKTIIYVNDEAGIPEIRKIPIDGGKPVLLANRYRIGFSPNKNLAIVVIPLSRDELALFLLNTKTMDARIVFRYLKKNDDDFMGAPLWSPNGKRVVIEIMKYSPQVSDELIVFKTDNFEIEGVIKKLSFAASIETNDTSALNMNVILEVSSMAWTPDGKGLLVSLIEPSQIIGTGNGLLKPGHIGLYYMHERKILPEEVSQKDLLDADKLVYIELSQGVGSGQFLQSGHAPVFRGGTKLLWMPRRMSR